MPDRTFTHTVGSDNSTLPNLNTSHFSLKTTPGTDIWRPSPHEDRFDAPSITTPIRSGSFRSLTCTISGAWKSKFDQGGLLLLWPAQNDGEQSKWLKAGIEFFEGKAALSVVGTDRFSDWSLSPIPAGGADGEATIKVERKGSTLWVYFIGEGGEKRALREIKWAWMEGRDADAELLVGVAAAKPAKGEGEGELDVKFRDWTLEVEE